MRRLLTTTLVAIFLTSPTAAADCQAEQEALKKCDVVIEKQDKLILIMKDRLDVVQDENEALSKTVVKLAAENEGRLQSNFTYGVAGLALGILATLLVQGK